MGTLIRLRRNKGKKLTPKMTEKLGDKAVKLQTKKGTVSLSKLVDTLIVTQNKLAKNLKVPAFGLKGKNLGVPKKDEAGKQVYFSAKQALNAIQALQSMIKRLKAQLIKRRRPAVSPDQPVVEQGLYEVHFYTTDESGKTKKLEPFLGPYGSVRAAATEGKSALRAMVGSEAKISEITTSGWQTQKPLKNNPKRYGICHSRVRRNPAEWEATQRSDGRVMNYLHPSQYAAKKEGKGTIQAIIFRVEEGLAPRNKYLSAGVKFNPGRRRRVRYNPAVMFQAKGKTVEFNAAYTGQTKGKGTGKGLSSTRRTGEEKKRIRVRGFKHLTPAEKAKVKASTFRVYSQGGAGIAPRLLETVTGGQTTVEKVAEKMRKKYGQKVFAHPVDPVIPEGKVGVRRIRRKTASGKQRSAIQVFRKLSEAEAAELKKKRVAAGKAGAAARKAKKAVKANPRRRRVTRRR